MIHDATPPANVMPKEGGEPEEFQASRLITTHTITAEGSQKKPTFQGCPKLFAQRKVT